jgi:AraC-like DNA-binding protein
MANGAYGRRLGEFVGVQAPPTIGIQVFQRAQFAVTRVSWDERDDGYDARITQEDAFLACLQLRDIPAHPYWVAGRPVPTRPVTAGQFTLLNLSFEHASYLRDPIDCLATYVSRAALTEIANEHGAPRIDSLHIPPGVPVDDTVVRSLGASLLPALQRPERANRLFLESVGIALLTHLACAYGDMPLEPQPKRGGLAPWQERRAKEAIEAHIDGDISLKQLADAVGLSRSHFARAFKKSTGVPPHRWLLGRRIERAQDLLLNSKLSIGQIASRCGFADQSHFTRVFAKLVHVGPGEWRRCRRR